MNEIPWFARYVSLAVAVLSTLGLILNHSMATANSSVSLGLLCIAPLGMFLGIGGAIEPKILWSMGKYGEHLPVKYKVIGGILGVAGLALTFFLALVVYRFGR